MKILLLTDIHGAFAQAKEIVARTSGIDVVILGGDLTARGGPEDAVTLVTELQKTQKQLLAVAGNMDKPLLDDRLRQVGVSIDGHGVLIGDAGFAGVSAAPISPLQTPYEVDEQEIMRRMEAGWAQIAQAHVKILVSHAPPYGTRADRTFLGRHVGSHAVRTFVDKNHPALVLCGHIHEARGQERLGNTTVVNSGPVREGFYAVIDLQEQKSAVELKQLG